MTSLSYSSQRQAKAKHRQDILRIIETKEPMFKDLQKEVGLTAPALTKHLEELVGEGLVTRDSRGPRRVVFILTDKGKGEEQLVRESIAKTFQLVKDLSSDYPEAKTLLELSKLAKDDPKFFNELAQWMADYYALMTSEENRQWIFKHGEAGVKKLREELTKRLTPLMVKDHSESEKSKELITILQALLDTTREVVSSKRHVS
jgi:DNA-binding MarR family transcriptional regulator